MTEESIALFVSYAPQDETLRQELANHLSLLVHQGVVSTWSAQDITAGEEILSSTRQRLDTAQVILLLVSADFLASDYLYGTELRRSLDQHQAGAARVIPILLRPVDWTNAPFAHLKPLPQNGIPVTQWPDRDAAFTDIAQAIRQLVSDRPTPDWEFEAIHIPENLPRSGVVKFVGREATMAQLHQLLQQGDRQVAISAIAGMGGIGKTELALQYALSYKQSYPGGLCWLSARALDVGTQIVRFARSHLGLNPPDDFELSEQVSYCYRNWPVGNVLLVLDDVTNYDAIKPYLPPVTEGRFQVLITTRLRLGRSVNQLQLDVLDEAAALGLLESLIGGDRLNQEPDCAKQLCEQLGYLPLGLELVGRYLDRKPDLSLVAMQQRLQAKRLAAQALCQTEDDMTAQMGVAAAFSLSWDTLSAEAKQLGYGLSLFAVAPIPWTLVEQCFGDRDPEDLEETRDRELLNLHLLQRIASATYWLHPLIRDFFQVQLAQSQEADALKRQFCRVMAAIAEQIPQDPTRQQVVALSPSIAHLAEAATALSDFLSNDDLIASYKGLGRFYEGQGTYTQAEPWYRHCLSVSRSRFGEEHSLVAESLNNLALLYYSQGRHSEVELLHLQALKLSQRLLGPEQSLVAESLNNLAFFYYSQGRYSEAEPLLLQALELSQRLLGPEHSLVAESFNNLALLYDSQGRYSEAELLHLQALELSQRLLGREHPAVAKSLSNLAGLYYSQRRYSEAEPLLLQALELYQRLLGSEHPAIAHGLNNLAGLYYSQGRYSEAEPLLLQALELSQRLLGPEHFLVADSLNNLAKLYNNQGQSDQAESLLRRALEIWRRTLGDTHPQLGRGLDNLGMLHAAQGEDQAAEPLFVEALAIFEQTLGTNHHRTIECREHLEQIRQENHE